MTKVTYMGFLGTIDREFPSPMAAEEWLRKVGKWKCSGVEIVTKEPEPRRFTVGQELQTRSVGDHNCIFSATVLGRTAKTVTISWKGKRVQRRIKIAHDGSGEIIWPDGRYSMAPIFSA